MNKSNLEHGVLSLISFIILYFITSNLLASYLAGIIFFLGREHAQYESKFRANKLKEKNQDITLKESLIDCFNIFKWSTDAKMDLLTPVIFNTSLLLLFIFMR